MKNRIVEYLSDPNTRISILRTLYNQGWRLDSTLANHHYAWQKPKSSSFTRRRKNSVLSYELEIDNELVMVELIVMIQADLVNADITGITEKMNSAVQGYDKSRVADQTLMKVIFTNSPAGTYGKTWKEENIWIVQVGTADYDADQHIEQLEKSASIMTNAMVKIP